MAAVDLNAHLSECERCRTEAELIEATWRRMGDIPEPEPRPGMATRFYAALDAYQEAMREKEAARASWWKWWPSQPLAQFAIALGCLAVGVFVGPNVIGRQSGQEMAELRKEMSGMRQLVTLSLLQQQSAAERLRGVNWSYRTEPNDTEVLSALLETVNQDSSVDVRLAAIDALKALGKSPVARRGLVQALTRQDSPLTQIAVVDALTELREPSATQAMQQLMARPDLDPNVRKRLSGALKNFE
jgi:hypothetical protein